jgi:hypothetical protein
MLFIPLENNKKKNLHEKMKNHAKEALILFFFDLRSTHARKDWGFSDRKKVVSK